MDLRILFPMLSVMYSGVLHTVLTAPAGETPAASTATPGRHVRTKRCSCATFLDKECVYFCHLDIIWINTPEHVVSYGLGNAPRTRRAVAVSMATDAGPRCKCLRENDKTCTDFCQLENHLRYETSPDKHKTSPDKHKTSPDKVILSAEGGGCAEAQCKHELAAEAGRITRTKSSYRKAASRLALGAALKTRLLLEKWRVRQRHRARAWEGESSAS